MIIDAAFDIARTKGVEQINARTVSQKLGCSTQPIMYHFSKIEYIKQAAYEKTDWFHSDYLMNVDERSEGFILGIGLNYIRFAIEEPHLFRFLFQSGYTAEHHSLEMMAGNNHHTYQMSPLQYGIKNTQTIYRKNRYPKHAAPRFRIPVSC